MATTLRYDQFSEDSSSDIPSSGISSIEIKTATEENSGLTLLLIPVVPKMQITVIIFAGSGASIELLIQCGSRTCKTKLDKPGDFAFGAVDNFSSNEIGDCSGFTCDQKLKTTLIHKGTDGWKCEHIK